MSDTTPDVAAMQIEIQRRMSGEERLRLAFEMSMVARDLLIARLRDEHPEWSRDDRDRELLRCILAPDPMPPGLQ